jgi:multiple sugar transport system permease protein
MKKINIFLSYSVLIIGTLAMLIPFYLMIATSMKSSAEYYQYPPSWVPHPWSWKNYVEVFNRVDFVAFSYNSAKIAVLSVLGAVISSAIVAYAFARLRFPGRSLLFGLAIATLFIPDQITTVPTFLIFNYLGWVDTHLPLWVPAWFSSAFGIFLLRQFFLTIPNDLEDAAKIDGCSPPGILWRIFLPLSKPAIATLAVFTFIGSWNSLFGPLIYLNSQEKYTLPMAVIFLRGRWEGNEQLVLAGAVISLIPVLIVFASAQKYFVAGIATTGMKG